MLALLNNCYKIPGNQLRQQIEAIFGIKIVDMFDSLNERRLQAEQPEVRGNGKAVSQFPKESVIAFEAIVDKIKEKYKECKKTNQDECLQFLKNFLKETGSFHFVLRHIPHNFYQVNQYLLRYLKFHLVKLQVLSRCICL